MFKRLFGGTQAPPPPSSSLSSLPPSPSSTPKDRARSRSRSRSRRNRGRSHSPSRTSSRRRPKRPRAKRSRPNDGDPDEEQKSSSTYLFSSVQSTVARELLTVFFKALLTFCEPLARIRPSSGELDSLAPSVEGYFYELEPDRVGLLYVSGLQAMNYAQLSEWLKTQSLLVLDVHMRLSGPRRGLDVYVDIREASDVAPSMLRYPGLESVAPASGGGFSLPTRSSGGGTDLRAHQRHMEQVLAKCNSREYQVRPFAYLEWVPGRLQEKSSTTWEPLILESDPESDGTHDIKQKTGTEGSIHGQHKLSFQDVVRCRQGTPSGPTRPTQSRTLSPSPSGWTLRLLADHADLSKGDPASWTSMQWLQRDLALPGTRTASGMTDGEVSAVANMSAADMNILFRVVGLLRDVHSSTASSSSLRLNVFARSNYPSARDLCYYVKVYGLSCVTWGDCSNLLQQLGLHGHNVSMIWSGAAPCVVVQWTSGVSGSYLWWSSSLGTGDPSGRVPALFRGVVGGGGGGGGKGGLALKDFESLSV